MSGKSGWSGAVYRASSEFYGVGGKVTMELRRIAMDRNKSETLLVLIKHESR